MTVHRVKHCSCGHPMAWHDEQGCAHGRGHVMGGCPCTKAKQRRRAEARAEQPSGLAAAIDETIRALTVLRRELGAVATPTIIASPAIGVAAPPRPRRERSSGSSSPLGKCERALLGVLAGRHPQPTTPAQLAILSGYSLKSSSLANAVGTLRSRGLATTGQPLRITDAGLAAAGPVAPLPSGRALVQHWCGQLGRAEAALLSTIAGSHPRELSKGDLAAASGYSITSSSFANALGKLRTLELVERGSTRLGSALAGAMAGR